MSVDMLILKRGNFMGSHTYAKNYRQLMAGRQVKITQIWLSNTNHIYINKNNRFSGS